MFRTRTKFASLDVFGVFAYAFLFKENDLNAPEHTNYIMKMTAKRTIYKTARFSLGRRGKEKKTYDKYTRCNTPPPGTNVN